MKIPLSRGSKKDPPIPESERVLRCIRLANVIVQVMKDYEIRFVGIEGYSYGSTYRAHDVGEAAGVVKSQIWLNFRIFPQIIPPSSGRKHVLGYGGPIDKLDIVRVVQEGLGVVVSNHHEADATVVARYRFDTVVAEEKEKQIP